MERRSFLGALTAASLGVALDGLFHGICASAKHCDKLAQVCLGRLPRRANFPRTQQ